MSLATPSISPRETFCDNADVMFDGSDMERAHSGGRESGSWHLLLPALNNSHRSLLTFKVLDLYRAIAFPNLSFFVLDKTYIYRLADVDRFVDLSKTCPPPSISFSHSNQYKPRVSNQDSVRWLVLDILPLSAGLVENEVQDIIHGSREDLLFGWCSRKTRCLKQTIQPHENNTIRRTNFLHNRLRLLPTA